MKILINRANPAIRISAPDEMVKNRTNCWAIWSEGDRLMLLDKDNWTLVEEEQPQEELVYRLNGLMKEYIKEGEDDAEKEHRFKCYQLFWDALEDADFFEQKEQNPAEWSEEDKHRCNDAIYFLETAKKHYADTSEIELTIDWLKSLRPQPKRRQSPALKKIVDNLTEEKLAKTRAEMKLEDAAEPVDLEKLALEKYPIQMVAKDPFDDEDDTKEDLNECEREAYMEGLKVGCELGRKGGKNYE